MGIHLLPSEQDVRFGYAMFQSVLFSAILREISASQRLIGSRMCRYTSFRQIIGQKPPGFHRFYLSCFSTTPFQAEAGR
jgi:hypothetical protein